MTSFFNLPFTRSFIVFSFLIFTSSAIVAQTEKTATIKGIILDGELKQYDDPYNVYHLPNSVEVVNFLNRGTLIPAEVTSPKSLENEDLGTITGNFARPFPIGSKVKLLIQPEDLQHDDASNLKLEVVDRKFRGSNFIYTLKTLSNKLIPVFVHSHHIHQHEVDEKFGIKRPIHIDHIVCF